MAHKCLFLLPVAAFLGRTSVSCQTSKQSDRLPHFNFTHGESNRDTESSQVEILPGFLSRSIWGSIFSYPACLATSSWLLRHTERSWCVVQRLLLTALSNSLLKPFVVGAGDHLTPRLRRLSSLHSCYFRQPPRVLVECLFGGDSTDAAVSNLVTVLHDLKENSDVHCEGVTLDALSLVPATLLSEMHAVLLVQRSDLVWPQKPTQASGNVLSPPPGSSPAVAATCPRFQGISASPLAVTNLALSDQNLAALDKCVLAICTIAEAACKAQVPLIFVTERCTAAQKDSLFFSPQPGRKDV
eukprot:Rmarinus@m.8660